jgi:RND family efflux transporter MFP subunit
VINQAARLKIANCKLQNANWELVNAHDSRPRERVRTGRIAICILQFAFCNTLLFLQGCDHSSAAPSAGAGAGSAAADRVTAAPPQRKDLRLTTTQPARIAAYEETSLVSRISGYVAEVLVDIGDPVTKDQPLLSLAAPEMQDDVNQKQALLAQAEAEVGQAAAAIEASQAAAESARARVTEVEAGIVRTSAECEYCQTELKRAESLGRSVTQEIVSAWKNKLRAAQAAQQEAAAAVDAARAAQRESEAGVRKADADHSAAKARHKVAAANLAYAETMLAYAEIKAPYDGVVIQRHVDTGHYLQPSAVGERPLLAVARTDQVRIFIDVPELLAGYVDSGEQGDAVSVRIQALPGHELTCPVTRTGWALDPANNSLRTEVDCPNTEGTMRPGMYATATIVLEERPGALTLPAGAIVRVGTQSLCCAVRNGKIVRLPLQLGIRSGDDVEVLSGLEPSETVVLARADTLQEGQTVEVIEPEKK